MTVKDTITQLLEFPMEAKVVHWDGSESHEMDARSLALENQIEGDMVYWREGCRDTDGKLAVYFRP